MNKADTEIWRPNTIANTYTYLATTNTRIRRTISLFIINHR